MPGPIVAGKKAGTPGDGRSVSLAGQDPVLPNIASEFMALDRA